MSSASTCRRPSPSCALETYEEYAWPRPLAVAFQRNGTIVSLATAAGIALVLVLTALIRGTLATPSFGPGAFYDVIPWWVMVLVAGVTFLFSIFALGKACAHFWRDTGSGPVSAKRSMFHAIHDILSLRNLGGGGDGCNDIDESFSQTRRRFHHAMFYGFLLCFASTVVATYDSHFLGWDAPYPFFSVPVLLGTVGGLAMMVGCGGMLWIKIVTDPVRSRARCWARITRCWRCCCWLRRRGCCC